MARVIFHIDINAFFASAHIILDPALKDKPVAVCSNQRGSVISAASYEARRYGIASAMPLSIARRLCSQLEIVELDFDWYVELSQRFIKIIAAYSPHIEQASIDECYVDVTEQIQNYHRPLDLAADIQKKIMAELMLPVSIGVAPTKFLAKMASDMKKPLGITILRKREIKEKLWPLDIGEMHGIGKKSVPRLKEIGIHTIGDLALSTYETLHRILGIGAASHLARANGESEATIQGESIAKSVSLSKTLPEPIADYSELKALIFSEISELWTRLQATGSVGKTIQFALRLDDYTTAVRSITLDSYIESPSIVFERVMALYDEFEGEGRVGFISIAITNLTAKEDVVTQLDLFASQPGLTVDDIIRKLNHEMKAPAFIKLSDLNQGNSYE